MNELKLLKIEKILSRFTDVGITISSILKRGGFGTRQNFWELKQRHKFDFFKDRLILAIEKIEEELDSIKKEIND